MHDHGWDSIESDLGSRWPQSRGSSSLEWDEARHATRDAWNRADQNYRGKVTK
jgi:hypothetical protein